MERTHITRCHNGNWIINLAVLLCNLNIIISQSCNSNKGTFDPNLPANWPCEWNSGTIPYVFNFYSVAGIRRLTNLVKKGHGYIERRSCLKFVEVNPIVAATMKNLTFLYYNYSGVLESCCLKFFSKPSGRRMVLITPVCTLPTEVAHATLHGLGLTHKKHEPFSEQATRAVMFVTSCAFENLKMKLFDAH